MNVRLRRRAEADLDAIAEYIAPDNPNRARSYVLELRERCARLVDMPMAYALRRDLAKGLRCCPHGSYLIFYRVIANEVQVVRILHAARDLHDLARHGDLNEPRAAYTVSPFEALGFLRVA